LIIFFLTVGAAIVAMGVRNDISAKKNRKIGPPLRGWKPFSGEKQEDRSSIKGMEAL
jgi:hypothetical protein